MLAPYLSSLLKDGDLFSRKNKRKRINAKEREGGGGCLFIIIVIKKPTKADQRHHLEELRARGLSYDQLHLLLSFLDPGFEDIEGHDDGGERVHDPEEARSEDEDQEGRVGHHVVAVIGSIGIDGGAEVEVFGPTAVQEQERFQGDREDEYADLDEKLPLGQLQLDGRDGVVADQIVEDVRYGWVRIFSDELYERVDDLLNGLVDQLEGCSSHLSLFVL